VTSAFVLGATLTRTRLPSRGAFMAFVVALGVVVIVALLERRAGPLAAADRALTGVVFGLTVPLLAYAAFEAALGGRRLDGAVRAIALQGGNRRSAVLGVCATLGLVLAVSTMAIAAAALLAAYSPSDPRLLEDLGRTTWIAALGGLAYAAWFTLASTFGAAGGGRKWLLGLDWVLGASSGPLAVPWPRGHLRNLLGGTPVLDMHPGHAALVLVVGMALALAVAVYKLPE